MNLLQGIFANSWKKFLVVVVSIVLVLFKETLDLSPEQIEALMVLGGGYFIGQGLADIGKGKAEVEKSAAAPKP